MAYAIRINGLSEPEWEALKYLSAGWHILNAQGATRANSVLRRGTESRPLARSVMVRLRDLGFIRYVAGAARAELTELGRRTWSSREAEGHGPAKILA